MVKFSRAPEELVILLIILFIVQLMVLKEYYFYYYYYYFAESVDGSGYPSFCHNIVIVCVKH